MTYLQQNRVHFYEYDNYEMVVMTDILDASSVMGVVYIDRLVNVLASESVTSNVNAHLWLCARLW